MNRARLATGIVLAAAAVGLAAPVQADDYDYVVKQTVNHFGIFGPQDQLAWLAKINCDRIGGGVALPVANRA